MNKRFRCILAVSALFLGATVRFSFAGDLVVVQTPDGRRQVMCSILEETYRYIRVEDDGQERTLYTDPKYAPEPDEAQIIVEEVRHGQFPPGYAQADMHRRNRRFADAFEGYREAASEVGEDTRWMAPYLWYYAGLAAFNEAKYAQVEGASKEEWYAEAADRFTRLLDRVEDHYFAPSARLGLLQAQLGLDRLAEAARSLQFIEESDYPDEVKLEARIWNGRVLTARGEYERAIANLQELQEELDGVDPALRYLAMLSEGYAWQGKEQYPRGENLFQEVGLRSPVEEMRAEAYNNRGLSLRQRGQPREALFSFLRVVVLHRTIRHEYQRGLYYAATTSKEYYSEAPQRARELGTRLAHRFPNSYWAQRLKREAPDLAG